MDLLKDIDLGLLPKGPKGDKGDKGDPGQVPDVSVIKKKYRN
jgi:hypothetical protein